MLQRIPFKKYMANETRFLEITKEIQTIDGLIPCKHIQVNANKDFLEKYQLSNHGLPIFPGPLNDMAVDYLSQHEQLWNNAAILVTHFPPICGKGHVFGVPFKAAVQEALASGRAKSKYYFDKPTKSGWYQHLLIILTKVNDIRGELLQLEAWQYIPKSKYAHYCHALSTDFSSNVLHFDAAMIDFNGDELDILHMHSKKIKGNNYQKHFRVDCEFDIAHMHNLAKSFFLNSELYDEAFSVVRLP